MVEYSRPSLTLAQAADHLDIATHTLAVWGCTQRYPLPYLKVGRKVRYLEPDVEEFLLSRRLAAPS